MTERELEAARSDVRADRKLGRRWGNVLVVLAIAAGLSVGVAFYLTGRQTSDLCESTNESRGTLRAVLLLAREADEHPSPAGRLFYRRALKRTEPIAC
jgi:hypothetical protein